MGVRIRINERGTQREVDEKRTKRGGKETENMRIAKTQIKRKKKESGVVSLAGYGEDEMEAER